MSDHPKIVFYVEVATVYRYEVDPLKLTPEELAHFDEHPELFRYTDRQGHGDGFNHQLVVDDADLPDPSLSWIMERGKLVDTDGPIWEFAKTFLDRETSLDERHIKSLRQSGGMSMFNGI